MPHVELPQAEFKVVMLGDTNVGKTSLVLRFAEGYYRDDGRSSPTVGAFFITKRIQTSNGITCKVQIWDTAGQEKFKKMAPMYYNTAAAAIICYDVSNPKSFEVMRQWVDELQNNTNCSNIAIIIAATKQDLVYDPTVKNKIPTTKAAEYAASVGAIFVETSSRSNDNIQLLFRRVSERVLELRERARNNGQFHRETVGGITGSSKLSLTPQSASKGALSGVGGGDVAAGGGGVFNAGTSGMLSENYGESGRSSPRNNVASTPTVGTDEWEEKMANENGTGLCSPFGCAADENKGEGMSCVII